MKGPSNKQLDSWIGWLQVRISELKFGPNEFWVRQAIDGYSTSIQEGDWFVTTYTDTKETIITQAYHIFMDDRSIQTENGGRFDMDKCYKISNYKKI